MTFDEEPIQNGDGSNGSDAMMTGGGNDIINAGGNDDDVVAPGPGGGPRAQFQVE